MAATFKTNPISLEELLKDCRSGKLQLPDFQRSWVWDEDRIKSLIASVSQAFSDWRAHDARNRRPSRFQAAADRRRAGSAKEVEPSSLLLDGQQRMTSLYQVAMRREVVETITPKKKRVSRWFYIDIMKALDLAADREAAIVAVPADKRVTEDFGREVILDISTRELEFRRLMFPLTCIFDWDDWQDGFWEYWDGRSPDAKSVFRNFKNEVLQNFKQYQVPVITLDKETTKDASEYRR